MVEADLGELALAGEAVEVEMVERQATGVLDGDVEGGAGYPRAHAGAAREALDERGLAGAKRAAQVDDVAGGEQAAELGGQPVRLGGAGRVQNLHSRQPLAER